MFSFAVAIALAAHVIDGTTLSYDMGGWEAPYGITLSIDAFSALLLLVVSGAGAITILFGRPSIDRQIQEHRQPLFYAAWLLALAGLSGMVVSADAFNIFVFMEISSLASYILIAGGPDRRALPATFKYLILGTTGATFYLIGVGLVYMMTGTLNLQDMEAQHWQHTFVESPPRQPGLLRSASRSRRPYSRCISGYRTPMRTHHIW
ncbi:MAG: proton-conducting transporter membrane subunit [Gammaproteobacteria bacterium]|nr:proton-conducting transporter membrane subunit [Gammaproteobacteria bacterium]